MKLQQPVTIYEAKNDDIKMHVIIEVYPHKSTYTVPNEYALRFFVQNTEKLFNDEIQHKLAREIYNLNGILLGGQIKQLKRNYTIKDCEIQWKGRLADYLDSYLVDPYIRGKTEYFGFDIDRVLGEEFETIPYTSFAIEKELTVNKIILLGLSKYKLLEKSAEETIILTELEFVPKEKFIGKLQYNTFFKVQELL